MNYTFGVYVENTLHDFKGQVFYVVCVHLLGIIPDDIHQILGAVLRHQVQSVEILSVTGPHDSLELDNILMAPENSEQANLSQNPVCVNVTFKNVLNLLDSDNFFVFLLVEILVVINDDILGLVSLVND